MGTFCCSNVSVVSGPSIVDTVGGSTYETIYLCDKCKKSYKELEGHNGYSFYEIDYSSTYSRYAVYLNDDTLSETIVSLKDLFSNSSDVEDDEIREILNSLLENYHD